MDVILGETVGEYNPDGSIKEDVWRCAFTGQFVRGVHSNREPVADTRFFYRVSANELHLVTDEWRAEFAAAIKATLNLDVKEPARAVRRPDTKEIKAEE